MTFYISSFRSEREAPSLPHCDTVFPVSLCQTYDAIPQTKKIPPLRPPGVTGAPLFSERLRTDMRNKPFSRIVIPSAAEESLLQRLPTLSALPSCMKHRFFPDFLRYGVSHSPLSSSRRYTANEKVPSTSLGMTIRKYRFSHYFLLAYLFIPTYNETNSQEGTLHELCLHLNQRFAHSFIHWHHEQFASSPL